jgi:adenosine deaminase
MIPLNPITDMPKADMHVHLEGTITPAMVQKIAARNRVTIPPALIQNGNFHWQDDGTAQGSLLAFVHAYDDATSVMKTAQDYTDITYDYLIRAAAENCIYAEIGISADHGAMVGLSYPEMLDAITKGYEQAKKETGIEARLISTCVRHFGIEGAMKVAQITKDHPHPLVTGFGMAGDENAYTVADFAPAFALSGLPNRTAHAGEAAGAQSVADALTHLGIRRFGHMVRAGEDAALMEKLKFIRAVPEVCVTSNMVLKVYSDYKSHPLRQFFDAGFKVVLGSDDPSFFNTSIGREYQIARDHFGFSPDELLRLTRNAIEEGFVDETTRARLLAKLIPVSSSPQNIPHARH